MKVYKGFLVFLTCLGLLFLCSATNESLAACIPPVKIVGDSYSPTSIQDAYDYASTTLGLPNFTLQLAGEIFTEDLFLDGGAVTFDGGYDCTFTSKNSTSSLFGTITISTGSASLGSASGGLGVVSTSQCAFDVDLDNYTRIGSCTGSADDCNDSDPNINPGAVELCDGIDNNCNNLIDEGLLGTDMDGDGYYASGSCGAVTDDCNDNDPSIHPGAIDIPYDGIDQDCNGSDLTFAGETCSNCHYLPTIANLHDLTTPPDATCVNCHAAKVANVLPGHYGKTVRTAGNNMTAGATITCTACHDQSAANHTGGITNGNGSDFVTTRLFAAWGSVPPSITCDTCHETRATLHATATAHNNRIINATCGTCHTSDTTVLGTPGNGTLTSAADVDTLHRSDCTLCHNYTGIKLDTSIVRQVIQQGLNGTQVTCTDCHTDKTSNHGNFTHPVEVGPNDLSYDAPGQLCSNCHTVANWAEIEGVTHNVPTNGAGSCATCHNSTRQEVIDTIALKANPTHCLDCHSNKQLTVHGTVDHLALGYVVGGTTTCMNCHDPGTAANATVAVTHLSNCSLCHTTVPALQPGIPVGGGDCLTCHTSTWDVIHTVNTPSHNTLIQVATTTCGNCHSDPPPLTDAADPKVHNACSSCHDATGARISLAVGKTFAVGGNCTTCHTSTWEATHTVNTPSHNTLIRVATTTCGNCHSDPPPLTDAADPKVHNACASCHDANGGRISLAAGKTFAAGGDCATCHTSAWSTIHAPHSHSVQVSPGDLSYDPPGILCSSCHTVANWAEIEGITHNVPTNGAGSCATCHNSTRQEVIDAIALGTNPTICLDCHSNKLLTVHGSVDHVALGYVVGGTTACMNCHDPGTATNATVTGTHLSNCALCHTTVPALQPGIPAGGGDCLTCHTSAWDVIHTVNTPSHNTLVQVATTGCASCHSDPPPLTDAADPKVHNACSSCHDANGGRISLAVGQTFTTGGNCASCHTSGWDTIHTSHSHTVALGASDISGGFSCSTCHTTVTSWTGINTTHDVATNGTGSCATCHSSSRQEVIDAIALGANPTNCLNCHSDRAASHGTSSCTTCHGQPPNGSSSPNTTGAHDAHDVLGFGSTSPSCAVCHDGATHNGSTDVNLLSDFDALNNAPASFDGSTCSGVSCHGGLDSPTWASGSLNVNSDCLSCHAQRRSSGDTIPDQYIDPWSGQHSRHRSRATCTQCHNTTNLATGHFSNLQTSSFEQGPATTVGGGSTRVTSYNGNTCTNSCHGSENWNSHSHSVSLGSGDLSNGTSCGDCHSVANWTEIKVTTHGSCATCHNSTRQEVIDTIALGATTNCLDCHSAKATTHGNHNHVVSLGASDLSNGTSCGDCHSVASWSEIEGTTHNVATNGAGSCATCHNSSRQEVIDTIALGADPTNCLDCHSANAFIHGNHSHAVSLGASDLSNGTSCGDCHSVASWSEIEGITHNVATNGSGSCATCHNSTRQAVIDTIAQGANPTNCLDCHSANAVAHGSVDHVAAGLVTLTSPCNDCHNPGSAANATVDVTHSGNCSLCHTTVPNLQAGVPAGGGSCATCHGGDVQTAHASCTTCHGEPPSTGGHGTHDVLGFGSTSPSCAACHDGASHYNGNTEVGILSSFDAMSGSASSNGSTCSSVRCHGGQTTPTWTSGSINVNTQCTSCHKALDRYQSQTEYNDAVSGRHRLHVISRGYDCTRCHSTTKLATGHFTNLETSTFEQDPGTTIGGSGTYVGSYDNANNRCSSVQCHGSENW